MRAEPLPVTKSALQMRKPSLASCLWGYVFAAGYIYFDLFGRAGKRLIWRGVERPYPNFGKIPKPASALRAGGG